MWVSVRNSVPSLHQMPAVFSAIRSFTLLVAIRKLIVPALSFLTWIKFRAAPAALVDNMRRSNSTKTINSHSFAKIHVRQDTSRRNCCMRNWLAVFQFIGVTLL